MAKYRVIAASVNIHAGVLGLEPHQAQARLHRLKPLGGNCYEIMDPPVAFKRGEIFDYEGELPKHVECVVSCPVPEEPFPVLDAEIVTEAAPDDRVAEPLPDQSPELFEQDLFVASVPDDGVAEKPPKRKKGPRGPKPAA